MRTDIAVDDPAAANRTIARVREAIDDLRRYPHSGRIGRIAGTREPVVSGAPYIVPYRIGGEAIEVLAIMHGARAWPAARV